MSEYAEKINILETRLAILDIQLKEAKQWCQDTIRELKILATEQRCLREKIRKDGICSL